MSLQDTVNFQSYTYEIITELRHMFADEKIDSRPVKYKNVIMWIDAEQRLHRQGLPAVEREDGTYEYWEKGVRKR